MLRRRGIAAVTEASKMDADFFTKAEAHFALWDMTVREKDFVRARQLAERLGRDFPDNQEVARFLSTHPPSTASGKQHK